MTDLTSEAPEYSGAFLFWAWQGAGPMNRGACRAFDVWGGVHTAGHAANTMAQTGPETWGKQVEQAAAFRLAKAA